MTTEKKQLQVGDEIAYSYYGKWYCAGKIDRITANYAFIGVDKFRREYPDIYVIKPGAGRSFSSTLYQIMTPEIKEIIIRQGQQKKLSASCEFLCRNVSLIPAELAYQIIKIYEANKHNNTEL